MSFNSGQLIIGEPLSSQKDQTQRIWDAGQFGFTATRGERGQASISLCLNPGQAYEPEIGWGCWIYDPPIGQPDSQCVFVGTIEDREIGYIGNDNLRIWDLTVLSLEQMFDTQACPEEEFNDADAGTIAAALFAVASQTIPVTIGTVEPGVHVNNRSFDSKTHIWAAIKQLAVDSNLITYIDPRDQKWYFVSSGARTTPFTLTTPMLLQNGTSPLLKYKQSRSDYRDVQVTAAQPGVLPPINEQFMCDGATDVFELSSPINQMLGAVFTTSEAATGSGTFTGVPSPGDTITVGTQVYTMVAALDNSVGNQVLIGATAADNASNVSAAVNAAPADKGVLFSSPTLRNVDAAADLPSGGTVNLRANFMGTVGNLVVLAESASNFTWGAATLLGGVNNTSIPIITVIDKTGNAGLYYQPGFKEIQLFPTPGSGQVLSVSYYSTAGNLLPASNSSAGALGIGSQYAIASPRNVTAQVDIQQQTAAILSGFSVLPGEFEFQTYTAGFFVGDQLTVLLTEPTDAAARLNGLWLIQDVRAQWVEGFENLPDDNPDRHFHYTVHCINSVQFNNYQDTLQRLVDIPRDNSSSLAPTQEPITGGSDAQLVAYQPQIQIADTTVGDDKGPHVTIALPVYSLSPLNYKVGQVQRLQGVLRKAITADLTIRINKITVGSPTITTSWEFTFPSGWPVDTPLHQVAEGEVFNEDIIYPDVVASQSPPIKDANGVAAVTLVFV